MEGTRHHDGLTQLLWSSMVSAVMHLLSSEEDGPSGSRTVALISGWDGDGERELSVPEVSLVGHRLT